MNALSAETKVNTTYHNSDDMYGTIKVLEMEGKKFVTNR